MSSNIPIILVFEPRAILAGRTRDWSQFTQVGNCLIPQTVMEELEFLTNRAVEPQEEQIAREFLRFLPDSTWEVDNSQQSHPSFTKKDGENLSKSARLQIAILESVYGIAVENPDKLVVFVANQSNLRENIDNLEQNNLTSLPLTQFIQWLRTKQNPVNITLKLQKFDSLKNTSIPAKTSKKTVNQSSQSILNSKSLYESSYQPQAKVKKSKTNPLAPIISSILALGSFIVIGGLAWYFIQPSSFREFWQKTGLPSLPVKK